MENAEKARRRVAREGKRGKGVAKTAASAERQKQTVDEVDAVMRVIWWAL